VRVNYQIVYVSDMKRSLSFYRDVLGIPLKFESPGWTEFATEGATLVLHAADAPATADDDPRKSHAGRCSAGFAVPSLADFHKKMIENKVPCLREPTQVFGAWVAQYMDPDGLAISVGETGKG
jgi:lactoylglutathione lyase